MHAPMAVHGALDYAELRLLGLSPDEVLDFSVNSNPYGPPASVRRAISEVPLERYPDRECLALRHKLADMHDVPMNQIVVGNGTAELLQLIAWAFLNREDQVAIPPTTFSEYPRVAGLAGAVVYPLDLDSTVSLDKTRMVFLCNPNNPDGRALSPQWIVTELARKYPKTLFIIDEAYANFLTEPRSCIPFNQPNILVVRSLTKDYAIAGLRLGYVVGAAHLVEAIRKVRPAWNVNALAQRAGLAVLEEADWLRGTVDQLHKAKAELVAALSYLGLSPQPSAVHYFLVDVGDGATFRRKLLAHKIIVRDCASFGLPKVIRLATKTPAENAVLLKAVKLVTKQD